MLIAAPGVAERVYRLAFGLVLACAVVSIFPTGACAYTARLVWRPLDAAAGYMVHVRYGNGGFQAPLFVGRKDPDADGLVRLSVQGVESGERTTFGVRAYDANDVASEFSNLITLTYAEVAGILDSDGDGFTDAQEDLNLDGVVDPWETDPHDASSALPDVCAVSANGTACDDGLACTYSDTCRRGVCRGVRSCPRNLVCSFEARACVQPGGDTVWIAPGNDPSAVFSGSMVVATEYTGGNDDDPDADNIASKLVSVDSTVSSLDSGDGNDIEYMVTIPQSALWYLWGRLYYPGIGQSAPNSFFVRVDKGQSLKFGNNRDFLRKWHWDGDGTIERGSPVPLLLGYLNSGTHMLFIEKREAGSKAPQLDLLALTQDPLWIPTDDEAVAVFGECGDGQVGLAEECDAGSANGDPSRSHCRSDCSLPQVCGDANGDGRVTATDTAIVQRAAVGIPVSCPYWRCDVNSNGLVSSTDAFMTLGVSVGRKFALTCADI